MESNQRGGVTVWHTILLVCLGLGFMQLLAGCDVGGEKEARQIAERLGTRPSWTAIRLHLEQAFVLGMSRGEVHELLARVGAYKSRTDEEPMPWYDGVQVYREEVWFIDPETRRHLLGWFFAFNTDWSLHEAIWGRRLW